MHVLQLTGIGGVQQFILTLVVGLKQKGINVCVFTYAGAEEYYVESLKKCGSEVFVSPYRENDLRNFKKIIGQINKWRVDSIHVHNTIPQIFCSAILVLLRKRVKGYVTEHSQGSKRRRYRILRCVDELSYLPYEKIITVSDSVKLVMMNWLKHIDRTKFVTIKNGIDTGKFSNAVPVGRESLGFQSGDFIIVSVGRLRPEKGFQTIVKALKELPKKYKLLIIGDGPEKNRLEMLSKSLAIHDRVYFAGNKNNVESYFKAGDLYVSASQSEGFGLTIIEAAAAGLPILASDIPAFREILPKSALFPVDSSRDLSTLINKHQYTQCNDVIKDYSSDRMVVDYIGVYNS